MKLQIFHVCGNDIETYINNLCEKIRSLNPSNVDFQKKRINIFNPAKKYFGKIKQEETPIGDIIDALDNEKNILSRDNITLEIEINKINEIIEELEKENENGSIFITEINNIIEKLKKENNTSKIKFYTQNILDPLEKKIYDIKQMIIVKEQSIIALQIIRRNNKEIIRNIDRVKNVTISALNTAVMVATSMFNQKIVLDKINSLEKGAQNITADIGNTLDEIKIEKLDSSSNPPVLLQKTFDNALKVFSEVDTENQKTFPESQIQIIELKKLEESYEKK